MMKKTMSLILILAMLFSLPANVLAALPQSAASDLLGYWDFEELKTGDDGAQYFEDKSGNGHDAVVTLGTVAQTDRDGSKAVAFANGSNTLLTAKNTDGDDSEFSFGQNDSFTLAGWIKVYDGSNSWQAAIQRGRDIRQGNGYIYYGLWLAGDGRYNYSSNLFGSTAVKEQWQHFAIVQNGKADTRQFWLNGQLVASGAAANGASSGAFTMGGVPNLNEYFHGELDEIAVYKAALTDREIAELAGVAPQEKMGLVAKWSFEDSANGVVTDVTGHGHDGVISGTPALEAGVTGKAMVFTGKEKVLVDNDPAFSTDSYTFSCWIKATGNGTWQTVFQKGREVGTWSGLWISQGNLLTMGISGGNIMGPMASGQWEHVALVQDMEAGTCSVYVNGLLVECTANVKSFVNMDKLTIGGRNNANEPEGFIGSIDEACFYDKALTQAEIIEEAGLGLHTIDLVVPAGATVEVQNIAGKVLVSAEENGSYQVTTGDYTIRVTKRTGAEKTFQEYIDADKVLNLSEGFLDYPVTVNLAEGAEILILGEEHRMYPDVDGSYRLPAGTYNYIVSKAGYQQLRGGFTVVDQEVVLTLPEMRQSPADGTRATSQADVTDRIKGGWIGEIAGVTWGAPTEFGWQGRMLKDSDVPDWSKINVNDVFNQDDLFVEIPFLKTFDEFGLTANWTQLGNTFRDSTFWLAHANSVARSNLRKGIEAPWSGHYTNNTCCDDIDWQIECDSIAMLAFGQPTVATELAWRLGHVMNYGDGVYGGVFVSAMYAAAGTAETFDQIIEAGIRAVPTGTKFRTMMDFVKAYYDNNPESTWRDCWNALEAQDMAHDDRCPEGKNRPFNIDARINSAYILIGLLYGEQDFEETMRISMCCGQDSDCNPSSAGGILGSYLGASFIPAKWTNGLDWNGTFNGFPEYSLTNLIDMNIGLAAECLELTGGKIENDTWTIPANESKTLILEQWPAQTNVAPSVTANVELDPTDPTGRTFIFNASATDSDGEVRDYQWFFGDLQYESGAKQTHTYPKDGTYYAICYATDDVGNTGWKQVEVNIGVNLKLNKTTLRLKAGAKSVLTLSGLPEGAVATWTSSNPEVATVDANGVVTAVKTGKANITAKYNESSATCTVTVVDAGTLVAKYDFETLGSTVEDVTGKNHTGTVHGTPTQIDRAGGKAISFTGREYITVARQDDFTSQSGDYTFAAWVKSTANSTYQTVFQIGRESSNHAGLWVFGRQYVFGSAAGNLGGSIASGDWQYVVIVQDWDLGTQTIYVDGVAVAQGPAATAPTQDAMTIGARSNGSEGFGGGVDDAAYYTRVMTLDEICKELGKVTYTVTIEKSLDLTVTVKDSNGYLMSAKEENAYPLVPGVYTISATNLNGNTYEETITVEDSDLTVDLSGLVEQKLSFDLAEGAEVLLLNSGKRIEPAKDGSYSVFPSSYSYIITKEGFEPIRSTVKVDKGDGVVTVDASEMKASDPSGVRVIAETDVEDRIKGGWIGEMAGVSWAASTEFRWQGTMGPDNGVPTWTPNTINGTLYQDDLYVEIPFLQAYEQYGLNANWEVLGNTFRDTTYRLWHANLIGRNNLKAGIPAPDSGHYSNNEHCDDIDWQIEADSTGMIAFGQPGLAQEMTWRAGHIMNYGDGVYGGVFVGTMYATAGTAETFDQVIEAGINAIPIGTKFRTMMDFVKDYYDNNPGSTWRDCWRALEAQDMAHDDRCPEGKDRVFNIDAKLNSAYILIGLLYGEQDFEETMRISMLCGQDSDCNPSSAAGILGSYLGLSNINAKWYEALRWDDSFEGYTGYSPNKCIETNIALAKEGLLMTGGSITGDGDWVIPYNPSKPLIREQWPEQANEAPELTVSVQQDPSDPTGRTYLFNASATDSDGEVKDYQWFFGDLLFASGAEQTHQYWNDGTYYAVCYTTDDVGNTSWKQVEIVVEGVDELAIVNQPEAFAGQIGEAATFHVDVTRKDATYQWMYSNNGGKSFVNSTMAGANTDTLTVEMKAFRVGQIYKCVISDPQGNVVETKEVAMTTATTLAIVTQPVDYIGEIGDTAVFTVEAQGEGLTYQWMYSNNGGRSWTKSTLPGYNTAEVSVVLKAFRVGQLYKCVVTDASGNVEESAVVAMSIPD